MSECSAKAGNSRFPFQDLFYRYWLIDEPIKADVSERVVAVGRFGLWMCLFVLPLSISFCFLFPPPVSTYFLTAHLTYYAPAALASLAVAYSGKLNALILANLVMATGVMLCWIASIELNQGFTVTKNYYVHLPLTAMFFVQNSVVFALAPLQNTIIGFFYFFIIVFWAIFRDHFAFPYQKPAMLVFAVLYLSIYIFAMAQYRLFRALNRNLVESQNAIKETEQSRNLLRATLDASLVGVLAFDEKGRHVLDRNLKTDFHRHLNVRRLKDFEKSLLALCDLDWRETSGQSREVKIAERYYLVTGRQQKKLIVFTFVDITERQLWLEAMMESQKLGVIAQLTSGIAHDYNNILAIALANIEAMPVDLSDPLWKKYLSPVKNSLNHAASISHRLLSMSNKHPPELTVFELSSSLRSAEPIFRSALGSEIQLHLNLLTECYVQSDPEELHSSILNILINAKNAIEHNKGRVSIEIDHDQHYANVSITDNGPGISLAHQSKVFEPFFTTKKSEYSSGLGLFMVKSFITASGGFVHLSSEPGQTRFVLALPLCKEKQDARSPVNQRNQANKTLPPIIRKPQKVMFVDDNRELLSSMVRLLEHHGVECLPCEGAQSALRLMRKTKDIDVVFLDLSMPEIDGISLAEQLMRINPSINYYILTGNACSETIERAKSVGIAEVLFKPLKVQDILDVASRGVFARTKMEMKNPPKRVLT